MISIHEYIGKACLTHDSTMTLTLVWKAVELLNTILKSRRLQWISCTQL